MVERLVLYRVRCFANPRGPWRPELKQARQDAVSIGLGSFDEWGQFFDVVPGNIERRDMGMIETERAA